MGYKASYDPNPTYLSTTISSLSLPISYPSVTLNYLVFLLAVLLFLTCMPVLMLSPLSGMHFTSFFIQLSPIHPQVSLHEDLKASFPGLTWFADRMDEKEKKWDDFKVLATATIKMGLSFFETGKTEALWAKIMIWFWTFGVWMTDFWVKLLIRHSARWDWNSGPDWDVHQHRDGT